MNVIVGGVIEKDGKYLLVQEAKKSCYKKWNIPAGHLDFKETISEGAIREIKEETGYDVELTGIVFIGNRILEDDLFLMIIFSTKLLSHNIEFDKTEILDVQYFDYDEIINNMDNKLRQIDFIKASIKNHKNRIIGDINLLKVLK